MIDLLTALGLMMVLEGALYTLFPDGMRKMMVQVLLLPAQQLRLSGLILASVGFVIITAVRGHS